MKKRTLTVKALVFLLVLMLVSGGLSLTHTAAGSLPSAPSTMTHTGQPVENLISLEYTVINSFFFKLGATPQTTDTKQAFIVPEGCKLVITDIYYHSVMAPQPSIVPIMLNTSKSGSDNQIVFYEYPNIVEVGGGQKVAQLRNHFTSGIVIEPGYKITASNRNVAYFMLRGYLAGSAASSYGNTQPSATAPIAPVVPTTLTPTPAGTGQLIGTNPARSLPSANSEPDPWEGSWITSNQGLGVMELSLSGSSATGTLGGGMYLLSGTVSGRTFTAQWMEPETSFGGKLELTMSEDGKSFTGRWNSSNSLGWQSLTGNRQ